LEKKIEDEKGILASSSSFSFAGTPWQAALVAGRTGHISGGRQLSSPVLAAPLSHGISHCHFEQKMKRGQPLFAQTTAVDPMC
jgi:hypothetical protein